jgi:hypothetical protein
MNSQILVIGQIGYYCTNLSKFGIKLFCRVGFRLGLLPLKLADRVKSFLNRNIEFSIKARFPARY